MKSFFQFFCENYASSLEEYIAHKHFKTWNDFVKNGGDLQKFGKMSATPLKRPHPLFSIIDQITEDDYPTQYSKILSKGMSSKWYDNLQKKVLQVMKNIINDEKQRFQYGTEFMYPDLMSKVFSVRTEQKTPVLEYRHKTAEGLDKPSVKANNGKDPFRMNKKNLHTVGPYKPMEQDIHKLGKIIMGDRLLAILAEYGIDFKDGEVSSVKNSPYALKMYLNQLGQPSATVIKKPKNQL
jgi:hypothetical protein